MQVSCPYCQNTIDWTADQQGEDTISLNVVCPKCDTDFKVVSALETIRVPTPQRSVAQFQLDSVLGGGAFGTVWLAHDTKLDRRVALKLPVREEAPEWFLYEARAAAALQHDHIVSIFEVGTDDDQVYIASEFIEGINLRDRMSGSPLNTKESVELCISVADALHHAHQHGVVHRDLKPPNILLDRQGRAFVTDFGIAKRGSLDFSTEGQIVGSPDYMSPEQARGQVNLTSPRSDVYSLGVVLFELLTRSRPYLGKGAAVVQQKTREDAPRLRTLDHSIHRDLETICQKCLEREPGKRYQTAADVADELRRFRDGHPILARPVSRLEHGWRWCLRRPVVAVLMAGLFLSLTSGLAGVSWFWLQAEEYAEETREYAEETERSLYRARMRLTSEALSAGDINGMRNYLNHYSPVAELTHLAEFEWRYFQSIASQFLCLVNHGDSVVDVAITEDGELLASCGIDRTVRIWSADRQTELRSVSVASGVRITCINVSPVADFFAVASDDGRVQFVTADESEESLPSLNHGAAVADVSFSADGTVLATAGADGFVRLWNPETGEQLRQLQHPQPVTNVRLASGTVVTMCDDRRVRSWSQTTGEPGVTTAAGPRGASFAVASDGQSCVVGTLSGKLLLWSLDTGKLVVQKEMRSGPIGDVEFLQGDRTLVAAANDGWLRILPTKTLMPSRRLKTHSLANGVFAISGGDGRIVVGSGDGTVKCLRVRDCLQRSTLWHNSHVRGVAVVPGNRIVACDGVGAVKVWSASGKGPPEILRRPDDNEMLTVAASSDGRLVAAGGMSRLVHVWDATDDWKESVIEHPGGGIASIAFSDSGELLAMGSRRGEIRVLNTQDHEPVYDGETPGGEVHSIIFAGNDRLLVVASSGGSVTVSETVSGRKVHELNGLESPPTCLALNDSTSTLAIGTQFGQIHLWDTKLWKHRRTIHGHSSRVNDVEFLTGGATLISASRDKSIRLWDTATGELRSGLSGHERQVFCLCTAADGSWLASGGLSGDVRLWHAPEGAR